MYDAIPLAAGAQICRHPRWGLCRAWISDPGSGATAHLQWEGGKDTVPAEGLTVAGLTAWGDRLLLALRSQRSDVGEDVLALDPADWSWQGIAHLESYGELHWAHGVGQAVVLRGQGLYRVTGEAVEVLGDGGRQACTLADGRVATGSWDPETSSMRLVLIGETGPAERPDAPRLAWEQVYTLDDGVAWHAPEGLVHWRPEHGARLLHPEPGPFLRGVWRLGDRLVWLVPESTGGPAELRTADGARLRLQPGLVPLWPLPEAGRSRWLVRRAREHVPQSAGLDDGVGFGAMLRAAASGSELLTRSLRLPAGTESLPEPVALGGPPTTRDRPVTALEVHPAVHAACAALGIETLGQLDRTNWDTLEEAVEAQGVEAKEASQAVAMTRWIMADLGLRIEG